MKTLSMKAIKLKSRACFTQVELGAQKAVENASASIELSTTVDQNAVVSSELARTAQGLTALVAQFRT